MSVFGPIPGRNPARREEMCQAKNLGPFSASIKTKTALERFQVKWKPVHRQETRKTRKLEPFCVSVKTKTALVRH